MARSRSVLIAAAVAIVFAAGSLPAQPCIDYSALVHPDIVGSFMYTTVTAADESHICSASYNGSPREVAWFRVGSDESLIREGTYYIDASQNTVTGMAVSGDLAILATSSTVTIVDFSTPESPEQLSRITAPGQIDALAACGDVICIGVQSQGLWIIDISDPSAPVASISMPLDGRRFLVQREGNVCWVASFASNMNCMCKLMALDIANPLSPIVLGSVDLGAHCSDGGNFRMCVNDGVAVINASDRSDEYNLTDCWVCDVADPSAPQILHRDTRYLGMFAIHQNMLFTRMLGHGIAVYRINTDGVITFEGVQGTETTALDFVITENSVWTFGDVIYRLSPICGEDPILYSKNFYSHTQYDQWGDHFSTSRLEEYDVAGGAVFLLEAFSMGDMGGVHYYCHVTVLDVTDPRSPSVGESIVNQGGYEWGAEVYNHIAVNGDYIYTDNPATGTWHWPSDSKLSDFHLVQGYFIGNDALYAVASPGLEIRDLSVPEDPPLVGTLLTDHEVHNLVSIGDHAYAQCDGSLVVLDVGNPLSPLVIEEMPMTDSGTSAAVSTESLLLAGDDGLFAYDLLNQGPDHPVQTGSLPGIAFDDVELSGGVAYLVVRDQGMLIVDVTDLANLEVIGRFDLAYLSKISFVGNCLAATTLQSYFNLIALDCSDTVPVAVQDFTATWQDYGFRLAWRLARDTVGLRLDANAGGRTWTVPWTREADGYAALDLDGPLLPGESVTYVLSARDDGGVWQELSRTTATVPELTTALLAPQPNPFNPTTTLAFTLERPQDVRLTIHDLAGREVRRLVDVRLPAGRHASPWDGRDRAGQGLPAGTYLARLQAGDRVETRKLSLVK